MYIHKTIEAKTNECLALLRSTKRDKIENLIAHITEMGYFVAPGSLQHHRFEGGLVSHSLETYHTAMALREQKILQGTNPSELPEASIILCSLLHDLCKADTLRYSHETHNAFAAKHSKGHSQRSVRQVGYSNTPGSFDEIKAQNKYLLVELKIMIVNYGRKQEKGTTEGVG